jgi:hypothetical protein
MSKAHSLGFRYIVSVRKVKNQQPGVITGFFRLANGRKYLLKAD